MFNAIQRRKHVVLDIFQQDFNLVSCHGVCVQKHAFRVLTQEQPIYSTDCDVIPQWKIFPPILRIAEGLFKSSY